MEGLKEYLESSTIHGLVYIATSRHPLGKLLWLSVVIAGFSGAVMIIRQSFTSWATSPVSTTIETKAVAELDFPNVVICPPRNSFTTLLPVLVMARNVTLDNEQKKELIDFVKPFFGPDYDPEIIEFYEKLFGDSPSEAILVTLARIVYMAREKDQKRHYQAAKALFNLSTSVMGLNYRDTALLTISQKHISHRHKQYKELKDYKIETGLTTSSNFVIICRNSRRYQRGYRELDQPSRPHDEQLTLGFHSLLHLRRFSLRGKGRQTKVLRVQ